MAEVKLTEARKRRERNEFLDRYKREAAYDASLPRRCDTNLVGGAGECLACNAEQGVSCAGRLALDKEER